MRLITKFVIIFIIIMSVSQLGIAAKQGKIIRGKIVAVNSQQGTFLLKTGKQIKQYKVGLHTKLFRNGSSVSLKALRPITAQDFQSALIKLDEQGKLLEVKVEYEALPVKVKAIDRTNLRIKVCLLNSQRVVNINYKSGIQLVRNDNQINFASIQVGDQGLIIRGLNDEISKIKLNHYKY